MVGASLARSLSACNLRVAVIEAWPLKSERQPSYDDRAIALAYGTRLIMEGMGVWRTLAPNAAAIHDIHVSDRGHFGFTRIDRESQQVDALGYVVTANDLGSALLENMNVVGRTRLYCPARLVAFQVEDSGVRIQISMGGEIKTLNSKLLVAADGVRSTVRKRLGISVREWGYGQSAVISNLTPSIQATGTAYERFTDTGPMAMLPLTLGRYGLVWTVDERNLSEIMSLDDQAFIQRIQQRFGFRLGRFLKAGKRSSYPLSLVQAKEHIRPRVALIGNAAHSVHPITGQGFNLGIRDVAVLADVLGDAALNGADLGSIEVLHRYAKWRRRDQQAVALVTDGLVRLFTNPLLPVRMLRNLGMLALDAAPLGKSLLARQFMGLNGRLPKLSRGISLG